MRLGVEYPAVEGKDVVGEGEEEVLEGLGEEEGLLNVVLGAVDVVDVPDPRVARVRLAVPLYRLEQGLGF